jgi:biopolymer transport protein ExbB/TolQ
MTPAAACMLAVLAGVVWPLLAVAAVQALALLTFAKGLGAVKKRRWSGRVLRAKEAQACREVDFSAVA